VLKYSALNVKSEMGRFNNIKANANTLYINPHRRGGKEGRVKFSAARQDGKNSTGLE
jgi:hypothetical protein